MATTIKSSDLDFENIKGRLKTYFQAKPEYADYDFNAAGLNNILDVLAYNTHVNGLTANFALNEAFLNTAQLRSSVVSHAEALGYDVRSKVASRALLTITFNLTGVTNRPTTVLVPRGLTFSTQIDSISYTFRTLETYTARDDGTGNYTLETSTGSTDIPVFEGKEMTKTFLVGEKEERQIYVIPDENMDKSTAIIEVYDTASSSNFTSYSPVKDAVRITPDSELFTIRESPNGYYEVNFGDGISFGKSPEPGNKIVITYLSSGGPTGNDGAVFTPTSTVTVLGVVYPTSCVTVSVSTGGAEKQSIESIKNLAPYAYATQQRLVTSLDYKATIQSNYTDIKDVTVWSGDQNVPIDYGAAYVSIKYSTGTPQSTKTQIQNSIVNNFTDNLSVMSITTKFVEPIEVFLELNTVFNFDPALTGRTLASVEQDIYNFQTSYFANNLGTFDAVFRRSNMLTEIDAFNAAILSSRSDVRAQLRFVPTVGQVTSHQLKFPMRIADPDDVEAQIISDTFQFRGVVAQLRNKLSDTKLQIYDLSGNVLADNVGQYNAATGVVSIIGFNPQKLLFGYNYIKVSVYPENQSFVKPLRNYVLGLDPNNSSASAIIDRQTTTLEVDN
jgi:hypothetical protein